MNLLLTGFKSHRGVRGFFVALVVSMLVALAQRCCAQTYSIDWYKIAGGGGSSSNGPYVVNGTIGQHDAGATMSAGNYSLTGGFWTFGAVQTPGAPTLNIEQTGPNTVLVWWVGAGNAFKLQTNSTLNKITWGVYGNAVNASGGTNSITVSPPRANQFFRLFAP